MRRIDDPSRTYAIGTQADTWWWCEPCRAGRHEYHVRVYLDPFSSEAPCECPHHDE